MPDNDLEYRLSSRIEEIEDRLSATTYLCQEIDELKGRLIEIEKAMESRPFDAKQWDTVQQLRGLVLHLQTKLNEHIDASLKRKKQPSYKYK